MLCALQPIGVSLSRAQTAPLVGRSRDPVVGGLFSLGTLRQGELLRLL